MGELKMKIVSALVALIVLTGGTVANPVCVYWCVVPFYFFLYDTQPAIQPAMQPNDLLWEQPRTTQLTNIPEVQPTEHPTEQPTEHPTEQPRSVQPTSQSSRQASTATTPLPLTRLTRKIQPDRVSSVSIGYPQPVANAGFQGYTTFPGFGTYKVHKNGSAWYDALRMCAGEGATLVVPRSQAEADKVKSMFDASGDHPGARDNRHFWVGVQERGVHGQFYTVFGDHLERSGYNVWAPVLNQLSVFGGTDCVKISQDGTYFDEDCSTKLAFVCKTLL